MPSTESTGRPLDPHRMLAHLLAKQHLTRSTAGSGVVPVADDLLGLHATSSMSPYLSAFARVHPFRAEDLDAELYEQRSVLRLKCMRGTVFVVSRRLAPVLFAATRAATVLGDRRWLAVGRADYERWAPAILEALAGRSLNAAELRLAVGADERLSPVISLMCDEAVLVRDRPSGSRRSSAFRYSRWDEVFPDVDLGAIGQDDALRQLVHRYVAAYGPVTVHDVAWWAGLPLRRIRAAVDALADRLLPVRIRGDATVSLMAVEDLVRADADVTEPDCGVALLPVLDPLLMGFRDRGRLLDPSLRRYVYDPGGNATSVVLGNGRVIGVWDLTERPRPAVRVLLFDPADPRRSVALERCAAVGEFWFGSAAPVEEYGSMAALADGRSATYPLEGARRR